MPITVGEIVGTLDRWFPHRLAESWDNVGLLIGDTQSTVSRVMACLTVTRETAAEAVRERVDFVITHHPVMFRKVQQLHSESPDRDAYFLARAGASVYSPHTAYDSAKGGINEQLCNLLRVKSIRPLRPSVSPRKYKLVVFVPESDLGRVQSAVFDAGAGHIGEYSECSFRVAGLGTFFGSEQSKPTIGERSRREEVNELRLEAVVPADALQRVRDAVVAAHSYEEPAYDVYPLEPSVDPSLGTGRWGRLGTPQTLADLARDAQSQLGARHVEFVGDANRICETLAVGCGAAGDLLQDAIDAGCDAFLTGEARFHECLRAESSGIAMILAGHYSTERFAVESLAKRVSSQWPELAVWASRDERDPATTVY